jgi:hypothetical protein
MPYSIRNIVSFWVETSVGRLFLRLLIINVKLLFSNHIFVRVTVHCTTDMDKDIMQCRFRWGWHFKGLTDRFTFIINNLKNSLPSEINSLPTEVSTQ